MLVYNNVVYVRIVSCELCNRLIPVCRTQNSLLDLIPICMSGGVHVAMYYNRQVTPSIHNFLTSTQTQCSNVINVQFLNYEVTGLYLL